MAERHSDKSPDAFRTISEVADHLDLPQHVLRFWETKFPEIKPVKRAGGRRFYRPEDVDLLRAIRHLLYAEGYTIKGVQKILKDQGARGIQAMGADLLEGRPVDLSPRAPTDVPAPSRGGLLGSLLPGRRNKGEARLIADTSPSGYDDSGYDDDAGPAAPPPRPPRSPGRPAAAFERQEPVRRAREADLPDLPARSRRAGDRLPTDMDPPDAFLPGFEMQERVVEPPFSAPRARPAMDLDAFADYPEDRIGREPRLDEVRPDPFHRAEPQLSPDLPRDHLPPDPRNSGHWAADRQRPPARDLPPAEARVPYAEPPPPPPAPVAEARPAMRRPTRGPASRVPEPAPLPELEDPLLPFFDGDVLSPPEDVISEPLNERIRRLKDHAPPEPAYEAEPYASPRTRTAPRFEEETSRPAGRVGPLTGVFPDDLGHGDEPYAPRAHGTHGYEPDFHGHGGEAAYPAEPRRQGPPEQYLPPHLRSEPRMVAAPIHAPQPVLSRDDMHRLQSALYELGECRRLLSESLRSEES